MKRINIFVLLCVFIFPLCGGVAVADETINNILTSSKDVNNVVDLNGKTYEITQPYTHSNGDVIIKNGTINANDVKSNGSFTDIFNITNGTFTVGEGLTITAKNGVAFYVYNQDKLIIDGGTVQTNSTN